MSKSNSALRQVQLITLLSSTRTPLTAEQIYDHVDGYHDVTGEARIKRFQRDKNVLREAGIDIRMERVADPYDSGDSVDGYLIVPGKPIPDPGLTAAERAILTVCASLVRGTDDSGAEEIGLDGIDLDALKSPPLLDLFMQALAKRRLAKFDYRSIGAIEPKARVVEPMRVFLQQGHWFVSGYERNAEGMRKFSFDRIVGDVVFGADASFARRTEEASGEAPAHPWEYGGADETITDVEIAIHPRNAWYVRRAFGIHDAPAEGGAEAPMAGRTTAIDGADWTIHSVPVQNLGPFVAKCISMPDDVVLVGPATARAARDAALAHLASLGPVHE